LSDVDIEWNEWKGKEKEAGPKKPEGGGGQPHP
ncbi:MAG: DNA-binding protein, partial [Prevotella pallens]|nr:DNA-binding protein [Prevotella pallens]